jgi:hypothetical protein
MLSRRSSSPPNSATTASAHQLLDPSLVNGGDAEVTEVEHRDDEASSGDEDDGADLIETAPQSISGPIGVFPSYCVQGDAVGLAVKSDSAMSSVSILLQYCQLAS